MAKGKKYAARMGALLIFADESGFMLSPNLLRTWAPRGQTPVFRHHYRRDQISVTSGVTVSPRRQRLGLYFRLFLGNIGQLQVCEFLRHLLGHPHGPVIVLPDNSTAHKGEPLRKLCRRHQRLHIEYFPSYAPQLRPEEAAWSLAKRKMANSIPDNVQELSPQVLREHCFGVASINRNSPLFCPGQESIFRLTDRETYI